MNSLHEKNISRETRRNTKKVNILFFNCVQNELIFLSFVLAAYTNSPGANDRPVREKENDAEKVVELFHAPTNEMKRITHNHTGNPEAALGRMSFVVSAYNLHM